MKISSKDIKEVRHSAIGTVNHTAATPKYVGKKSKPIIIKPNVLRKEMKADTFPLDKAVKVADVKMFIPINRKWNKKIVNPGYAIW